MVSTVLNARTHTHSFRDLDHGAVTVIKQPEQLTGMFP